MPKKKKPTYPQYLNVIATLETEDIVQKIMDEFTTEEFCTLLTDFDLHYQDWAHTLNVFNTMANILVRESSELLDEEAYEQEVVAIPDCHSYLEDAQANIEALYHRLVAQREMTEYDKLEDEIMRNG